jgi:hypothetical protein
MLYAFTDHKVAYAAGEKRRKYAYLTFKYYSTLNKSKGSSFCVHDRNINSILRLNFGNNINTVFYCIYPHILNQVIPLDIESVSH